jgi:calcium/calmodulin-dependent 3',5'-cyclic nucleotide phosphodiesterase
MKEGKDKLKRARQSSADIKMNMYSDLEGKIDECLGIISEESEMI